MAKRKNNIYAHCGRLPYEVDDKEAVFGEKYRRSLEGYTGKPALFEGEVLSVSPERVLVKDLYVYDDGQRISGREDHVYVYCGLPFLSFEERDLVSFIAIPYIYKREDGLCDIALKNASEIKKISYGDDKRNPQISEKACVGCRYKEVCCGKCCIPEKKEKKIDYLIWKKEKEEQSKG